MGRVGEESRLILVCIRVWEKKGVGSREGRGRGQEIFLQLSEVEECNNPFLASDLMDASHIKKEQRNTLPPVLECNAPFQAFSLC